VVLVVHCDDCIGIQNAKNDGSRANCRDTDQGSHSGQPCSDAFSHERRREEIVNVAVKANTSAMAPGGVAAPIIVSPTESEHRAKSQQHRLPIGMIAGQRIFMMSRHRHLVSCVSHSLGCPRAYLERR
jgi:hypothetical protein